MRDPKDSQIDRHVDPRLIAYLGAAKTLLGRTGWYSGKAKFVMVAVLLYDSSQWLQGMIPSIYHWILLLGLLGLLTVLWEYLIMWPSEIIFANVHDEDANRSPIRKDTQRILELLEDRE